MDNSTTIYRSKIGLELVIPLAIVLLGIPLMLLLQGAWQPLIFNLLLAGFVAYLFSNIYYEVSGNILRINGGFLVKYTVNISDITNISETRDLWSAPAASLDRLYIVYGKGNAVLISPKEKAGFIRHLLSINPNIEVKYRKK